MDCIPSRVRVGPFTRRRNSVTPREQDARMCLECDGYSHEQAMQALDLQIRVRGWALVQVKDESTTWCYTVGLLEHYDHPELALIDVDLEIGSKLMTELVEGVTTRGVVSSWLLRREGLRCVEVHPDHLRGDLFGTWSNLYGSLMQRGDMLQVLLADDAYCECHVHLARRLDVSGSTPSPPRSPNREERRRRARRGRAA